MKRFILTGLCFLLIMAVLPFLSYFLSGDGYIPGSDPDSPRGQPPGSSSKKSYAMKYDNFKILDTSTNEIITVDDQKFCCGALAAEMPPSFAKEALKAQTVALYTFFCREREAAREKKDKALNGADFKADLKKGEKYLTQQAMAEKFGDAYKSTYKIYEEAVAEVFPAVALYEDKLICAMYFSISGGTTESCAEAFEKDIPYLRPAVSDSDRLAELYQTKLSLSPQEFADTVKKSSPEIDFPDDTGEYIKEIKKTASGYVSSLKICGKSFTGSQMRNMFSLRSSNFDVSLIKDEFVFTVRGYGHGVGMSQYGANYMAQQGAGYIEILKHYYNGISLA